MTATQAPTPGPLTSDGAGPYSCIRCDNSTWNDDDICDQCAAEACAPENAIDWPDAPTAPVEASGQDDHDLKLIIAHTIIEDLRVQHPGIEQIDNERGDIWLPGGSTPQSSGCIIDIHSVAQSVEQQVLAALRPGHTDLMVSPENIDAFLEANPPPVEASGAELHPATANLVDRFATELKSKLAKAEAKYGYRDNWSRPDWEDELTESLAEHIQKGDPRDVAAYCAFAWHHGWSTSDAAGYFAPALRPQPSGETREALDRLKMAAHVYEDDEMAADCATLEALLSARPLALGGQQGEVAGCAESEVGRAIYERIEKLIDAKPGTPEGDELSFLAFLVESVEEVGGYDGPPASISAPSTPARAEVQDERPETDMEHMARDMRDGVFPARSERQMVPQPDAVIGSGLPAEAQDEGAAGEVPEGMMTIADELEDKADELDQLDARGQVWGLEDVSDLMRRARNALRAHPSPTPAADADRVRIAVGALEVKINAPLTGPTHGAWDRGRIAGLKEALAALKSTAAKEGGE